MEIRMVPEIVASVGQRFVAPGYEIDLVIPD